MLTPLNPKQWDLTKAAHLLNRAGFGGSPEQIHALHKDGLDSAVNRLFQIEGELPTFPDPDWLKPRDIRELRQQAKNKSQEERRMVMQQERKTQQEHLLKLISWWLDRMQRSSDVLREKMTLFWHGHFATSFEKVKDVYLMWIQNDTLRENALGNFGKMVKAISRDPAMIRWLDTNQSNKHKPNENFARELMELFTLGVGNYTEKDVQESARAFTGYKVDGRDQSFRFARMQHDDGKKKFLGRQGDFSGDDIIDEILKEPACARFICNKIWEFFVYEDPETKLIEALAARFHHHKYEINPLMNDLFRSAEFYSPKAIRSQVKSPVQWMVQTTKILGTDLPRGPVIANALRQMGQLPFMPPSVKGWDGGKSWITTSTLLFRYNLANFFVGKAAMPLQQFRKGGNKPQKETTFDKPVDFKQIAPLDLRQDPRRLVENLCFRLYQGPVGPRETETFMTYLENKKPDTSDATVCGLLHLMMSTPQFQIT